jgi:8-oxo-dGTP diphosphatase
MTDGDATGSGESPLVPCVGGLVFDDRGRLLLVRRANEPGRGLWSVPGGRVEPGEDDHAAVVREMAEETGLVVRPGRLVGVVERGPYRIADYLCTLDDPAEQRRLRAGDDADDARFVDAAAFAALPLVPLLAETLSGWDVLPRT